jgi:hypothetical protein
MKLNNTTAIPCEVDGREVLGYVRKINDKLAEVEFEVGGERETVRVAWKRLEKCVEQRAPLYV